MTYQVVLAGRIERDLKRLPRTLQRRLTDAMAALADNPRPPGCKKLQDEDNLWRIRVGDYRIVYTIQDDRLIVLVIWLGNRKDAYR